MYKILLDKSSAEYIMKAQLCPKIKWLSIINLKSLKTVFKLSYHNINVNAYKSEFFLKSGVRM